MGNTFVKKKKQKYTYPIKLEEVIYLDLYLGQPVIASMNELISLYDPAFNNHEFAIGSVELLNIDEEYLLLKGIGEKFKYAKELGGIFFES